MRSADRDGGVKGDDETTSVLNSLKKGRIAILLLIRITQNTCES
jgi:hypothetical protein